MKIINNVLVEIDQDDIINGSLTIPNDVKEIGEKVFYKCSQLKEIVIPEGVYSISKDAFSGCENLEKVKLPSSLINIGDRAFYSCSNIEEIDFPKGLSRIGISAFSKCSKLKKVKLPNSLKELGIKAFNECRSLESINIPKGIEKINEKTFNGCEKLSSIDIPDNIKYIGTSAFGKCISLKEVVIPDSVKELGKSVFNYCLELKSVKLSKNLSSIPEYTFSSCLNLTSLSVNGTRATKSINIPSSINSIDKYAFLDCESIDDVIIPESVDNIEDSAFKSCKNLTNIKLPNNLKLLKDDTFNGCTKLENIKIPESVVYIGNSVFANCSSLKSIIVPDSVVEMGRKVFEQCSSLSDAVISDNVKLLKDSCFSYCSSLKNIKLPKNLETLGEFVFRGTGFKEFEFPDNVTNAGTYTFDLCESLESIKLPSKLEQIKKGMFQRCTNLQNVSIPDSLQEIGNYAFTHCRNLKSLSLPQGLKTISHGAFFSCLALQDINIPNTVESIKDNAFSSCPLITSLSIPNSVKELGPSRNNFDFFEKTDDGFILSSQRTPKSIPVELIKIDLPLISRHWEHRDMLFKEQNNDNICYFYNTFLCKQPEDRIVDFLNSHNFKFFKQLNIPDTPENKYKMFNMLYNLGAVTAPIEYNGKTIDFAQKVVGFLLEAERKGICNLNKLRAIFSNMKNDGFNPEFTTFYLANFPKFIEIEKYYKNFSSRSYNEYADVQRTNTSNRGSQRQLKPTLEKFVNFFLSNRLAGITDENRPIAEAISRFFYDQELFDLALGIFDEKAKKNTPDNILSVELKENPFETIDQLSSDIKVAQREIAENLVNASFNQFSYEWLAKNDPQNLILGKLCSCCAHIDGAGYGIMRASIVDPHIQNLVIRNAKGAIIAKSTLYINPIERYGVFNNVEISENVSDDDKKYIYDKFILGAKKFAEEYNREFPQSPLKQINVGMNANDLSNELTKHSKQAKRVLRSIDYSIYGREGHLYSGDSELEQYIVWQNNTETPCIEKN